MDLSFTFYLLLLMLLSDCSNANSKAVLSLSSSMVTEFNPLTLSCKYMGNETVIGTDWISNGARVGVFVAGCVLFVKPDPGLYDYSCSSSNDATLTIKNITTANHGDRWYCSISIGFVIYKSKIMTISVRVAAKRVNITYPNEEVITIRKGNVVALYCETSFGRPKPDITWYKDENTLDIFDDVKLIDNVTYQYNKHLNVTDLYKTLSTLLYTPTRFDHGMRIYCVANNTHETTIVSAKKPQLNVEYGPVNIDFNTSTSVFELDEQTRGDVVFCSADCNPSCIVSWHKFGQNSPVSRHALLDLGVLSRSDNGTYVCKATSLGTNIELTKSLIILVSQSSREIKSDNTTLIVRIALGVFIVALITYGIYMTVVVRRLKSKIEIATDTSVRTSDVGTEMHQYRNASIETSGEPSERGTTNDNLNPDAGQYLELDRVNLRDSTAYETIGQD